MQATNGIAVHLFRGGARVIGCLMATALVLSALVLASTASAAEPPNKTYLALGDDHAFGYSMQLFNENFPSEKPQRFENGYVNDYLKLLEAKQLPTSTWQLVNDACPLDTSDSMIGNGTLAAQLHANKLAIEFETTTITEKGTVTEGSAIVKGLAGTTTKQLVAPASPPFAETKVSGAGVPPGTTVKAVLNAHEIELSAPIAAGKSGTPSLSFKVVLLHPNGEKPCFYKYQLGYKLHHQYAEKKKERSQLEDALTVIKEHNQGTEPQNPVQTITLNISGNDQLKGIAKCRTEIREEWAEKGEGHSLYDPTEFEGNPNAHEEEEATNGEEPNGTPANEEKEFAETLESCNVAHVESVIQHTVVNISAILAAIRHGSQYCIGGATAPCGAAEKGVNYTGKIIFLAEYDPYGHVGFEQIPASCEQIWNIPGGISASDATAKGCHFIVQPDEILKNTNILAQEVNFVWEEHLAEPAEDINRVFGPDPGPTKAAEEAFEAAHGAGTAEPPFGFPFPGFSAGEITCSANPYFYYNPKVKPLEEERLQTLTNMYNQTISNSKLNGADTHETPLGYNESARIINESGC